jgi:hypothetical protein
VLAHLDGQIEKEDPIRTPRHGPMQEEQADAQQPQANGFSTRARCGDNALKGREDQGNAAIAGVRFADPSQSQANQLERVDMPFGVRQIVGGN